MAIAEVITVGESTTVQSDKVLVSVENLRQLQAQNLEADAILHFCEHSDELLQGDNPEVVLRALIHKARQSMEPLFTWLEFGTNNGDWQHSLGSEKRDC